MSGTECVLLDAAGTLLWKPDVIPCIASTLGREGIVVDAAVLRERHKLVSELVEAPDVTGWDYYASFNVSLLRALGVPATGRLVLAIYESCRSLPWALSPGADTLSQLNVRIGVVSNWDSRLGQILESLGAKWVDPVVTSTSTGIRKPDARLFLQALDLIGTTAERVLFIGDSLRLDIEPALRVGMRAALYDPDDLFPHARVDRIRSLAEVERILI